MLGRRKLFARRRDATRCTISGRKEEEVEHGVVEERKKCGSSANGVLDGEEEVRVQA